jgi:tetratricopeptide (TPR) repeat protein
VNRLAWEWGPGSLHRELLDALAQALETRNCRLEHVKWFVAGRSGSPVAGIIRHEDGPEQRILKFCSDRQHQSMRDALLVRNSFVKQHLPRVERDRIPLGGDRCAVYLRMAGDDVEQLESIEALRERGREIDYAKIVKAVIGEWNEDRPTVVSRSVRSVVSGIVGRRRGPALRWIRGTSHISDFAPVCLLAGAAGREIVQNLLVGNAHGDLSSRNILIPSDPRVRSGDFQLIDYDHFSATAPLARDPMHFLVGLALDDFSLLGARRQEVIKAIVNPHDSGLSDEVADFVSISTAIHDACADSISSERGLSRRLREQCLLSLVGVALRHVGRDRQVDDPEAVKRWCYDLAVAAAHRFGNVRQEYEGPPRLPTDADAPAPAHTMIDRYFEREALTDRLEYGPHGVMSVQGERGVGKTKLVDVVLENLASRLDRGRLRTLRHHTTASLPLDVRSLVELISDGRTPNGRGSPLVLLESVLSEPSNTPVVVTVAEADNLLEPETHRVADPDLAEAFEILSAEPDHRVSIVLEARHSAVLQVARTWPDDDTVVVPGMEESDFLSMLRRMHRGMGERVDGLSKAERTTLWRAANGNPRVAELVCASACEYPICSLAELVRRLHENRKSPASYLIGLLLEGMPTLSVKTIQALAVLRVPLPARAVAKLVRPAEPDIVREWLENLADRRVIGKQGELYFLSPGDAETVIGTIAVSERPAFFYSAAEVLEAHHDSLTRPQRVDDLRYQLAEVDCLIDAGQHGSAFDVMADVDNYLREWNCAALLCRRRERIRGRLDTPRQEQYNEDALGGIYVALGKLDLADKAYGNALKLAGPNAPPTVLSRLYANFAVMNWAAGNIGRAQGYNEYALEKATVARDRTAMMGSLIGLADGHRRHGEFTAAIARGHEALKVNSSADPAAASTEAHDLAVMATVRLSRWHAEQDDLREAGRWLRETYELAGSGPDWHRATYLDAVADLRLAEGLADGEVDEAITAAREAVGLAYRLQDSAILLQSRTTLCVAHLRGERYADASLEIRRTLRHRPQGRHLVIPALLALTARLTGNLDAAAKHFDDLLVEAARRIERDTDDFSAYHFYGFATCGLVVDGRGDLPSAVRSLSLTDLPRRSHAPGLIARLVFLLKKLDDSGAHPGLLQPAIDALQGGD